ncbi:YceD family protein [Streptococcus sp. DD12]|uniref:YceD family protein n=1 Tax=Streptococcus sp. DD12 TaxID=1777880 RepID=UPI00079B7744|nr:YceD family protein [Streptococcus sp. DD12]KXT75222.1 hypothetical protein STRDD12_01572 [Streptococcus sp. DD12]
MLYLKDIQKAGGEGLSISETLQLADEIKQRDPQVEELTPVQVEGHVSEEDGLYVLTYQMTYTITLPSSRSLQPVALEFNEPVTEIFVQASQLDQHRQLVDDDLALLVEGDRIDLSESVVDNILMAIPLRVLTDEEVAGAGMVSGKEWEILSEEDYQARKEAKKAAENPFGALSDLFSDEEGK